MATISTRELSGLPDVAGLERLLQSLAMLDAIYCPEWEFRYYSFNAQWSDFEQMGSMRDGSGNEFYALFNPHGCFLKGFDHEAKMSPYRTEPPSVWPGLLAGVPGVFADCLNEPAFNMRDVTFCIWRQAADSIWQHGEIEFPPGDDPDGSIGLLSALDGNPATYRDLAADYYADDEENQLRFELPAIDAIYRHLPLTEELVASLNPSLSLEDLRDEATEIGYPLG